MKIVIIHAASQAFPGISGTDVIMKTISETLTELGEEVVHIRLDRVRMPFYGSTAKNQDEALSSIHNAIYETMSANGVVFIAPAVIGGLSALMKAFLEHLSLPQFAKGLMDKNCMTAVIGAENGGARSALSQLSDIVTRLGGNDAVRVGVPKQAIETSGELKTLLEKHTEDYYRILRQNRKFFQIDEHNIEQLSAETHSLSNDERTVKIQEIREMAAGQSLTKEQEEDISGITKYITERFNQPLKEPASPHPLKPRNKSCKQLTVSMPHYYNPQLAAGIKAAMVINITGEENFTGTLYVDEGHCVFEEGQSASDADMSISADTKVWSDVLTGRFTAQKAFMVGSLKVRGNFLLLAKLDQLFNKIDP